ncbi:hypothetical protein JOE58_002599 [Curtobacterium luteum]|uniref:Uncharacterized protein n=1 Tax=Curtobacterium luteum TaxID=33881 RepID=A0ABS2RXC3_9MICO|nr:hypothetical protein [Curtobacterium luteum]
MSIAPRTAKVAAATVPQHGANPLYVVVETALPCP